VDPFGTPYAILLGYALDQRNRLCRQRRATTAWTGFEFPEQAESLAMPAQESLGLKDQEGILPVLEAAGEEDQPQAIALDKGGLLDLALENNQLLPEESVLGDQFGPSAGQVGGCTQKQGLTSGLGEQTEGLVKCQEQVKNELSERVDQGGHELNSRKLSKTIRAL
jgi:hypothetical protein